MGRKGKNIRQRKDGRWEARLIVGYSEENKAVYRSIYGGSLEEVRLKKAGYLRDLQDYRLKHAAGPTREIYYGQFLNIWLHDIQSKVKQTTWERYVDIVNTHIRPVLGECLLSELDSAKIHEFEQNRLTRGRLNGRGGLAPKTVASMVSLVKQTIKDGQKRGYTISAGFRAYTIPKGKSPLQGRERVYAPAMLS